MSGKKRSKTFARNVTLIIAAIVIGIALFTSVFVVSTSRGKDEAVSALERITDYVKKQCVLEDEASLENEAKSLVGLVDKALEARNYIRFGVLDETEENLNEFVVKHRLSGIVLTDAAAAERVVGFYGSDGTTASDWNGVLDKYTDAQHVLSKSYSERVTSADGEHIEYAVVGREDKTGLILCYVRQKAELAVTLQYSIQNILKGYSFGMGGIIVVTDGIRVVATNVDKYMGRNVASVNVVEELTGSTKGGKVRRIAANDSNYLAVSGKSSGYYVYALMAEKDVYEQRSVSISYAMSFYILVVVIIASVLQLFDRSRAEEQRRIDAENTAKMDALAKEAIRANNAKTDFLRRMSHDIRTPINGIRGMLKIADYYDGDQIKQRECREKMWQASGYLLDILNDVLDMSKLDSGNMVCSDEKFALRPLLSDVETMMKFQAHEKGIELEDFVVEIEHNGLFGAAVLFKRTLVNVLTNAIKYNRPGGKVSCLCRETGCDDGTARFKIIVSDTGIGMSEDFLKIMYEPFAQEHDDPSGSAAGVGLGLAIVKKAVEIMGGTISAESKVGEGTTFTFDLPFTVAEESEKQDNVAIESELSGLNILLVEDNDLNREFGEFILTTRGATVALANDGKEALDKFISEPSGTFDVILMDIMMPVMDGIEATKGIRSSDKADALTVPIVAMTANGFDDDVERVLAAGMNAHISKPVDADKLVAVILDAVRSGNNPQKE